MHGTYTINSGKLSIKCLNDLKESAQMRRNFSQKLSSQINDCKTEYFPWGLGMSDAVTSEITESEWLEHGLNIYQVQSSTQTRRKFRQVARETCGESMEPPDDNLIMFGEIREEKDPVMCVICAKHARIEVKDKTDCDYYHWINFLFVKGDFQRHGYGSLLLNAMETVLRFKTLRPIRVDSAFRAVEFFKSQGYSMVGEARDCVFSGSALFRTLQTMEKFTS